MAHTGQVDGLEEGEPVGQPHEGSKKTRGQYDEGIGSHDEATMEGHQRLTFISKRSGKSERRPPPPVGTEE
eukprot:12903198-Prorocentrum_lima.AAC.1